MSSCAPKIQRRGVPLMMEREGGFVTKEKEMLYLSQNKKGLRVSGSEKKRGASFQCGSCASIPNSGKSFPLQNLLLVKGSKMEKFMMQANSTQ